MPQSLRPAPDRLHRVGGARQSARARLRAWPDPKRPRLRRAGRRAVGALPRRLPGHRRARAERPPARSSRLRDAAVRGRHGHADRPPRRRQRALAGHLDGRADRPGAGRPGRQPDPPPGAERRRSGTRRRGPAPHRRLRRRRPDLDQRGRGGCLRARDQPRFRAADRRAVAIPDRNQHRPPPGRALGLPLRPADRRSLPRRLRRSGAHRPVAAVRAHRLSDAGHPRRESDLLARATWQAMAERGPRAQLAEFPGVGHAPMFQSEDQIGVVRDFLLHS